MIINSDWGGLKGQLFYEEELVWLVEKFEKCLCPGCVKMFTDLFIVKCLSINTIIITETAVRYLFQKCVQPDWILLSAQEVTIKSIFNMAVSKVHTNEKTHFSNPVERKWIYQRNRENVKAHMDRSTPQTCTLWYNDDIKSKLQQYSLSKVIIKKIKNVKIVKPNKNKYEPEVGYILVNSCQLATALTLSCWFIREKSFWL